MTYIPKMPDAAAVSRKPIHYASACVPVCEKHNGYECWVLPGGVHTDSCAQALDCARDLADLIGPAVPTHSVNFKGEPVKAAA